MLQHRVVGEGKGSTRPPLCLQDTAGRIADASAGWGRQGRLGQPRTLWTGMYRDKVILGWELLPSMGKMDWELSSRMGSSGSGVV